eukprot:TRINITY_DN6247_c0_g2_i11.p1 TRINITY_DN6247_c0_g2~~TRINITY_DN6247_c0_g2_i11.p1  ORF type:complete len:321 (-),score=31.76 TRINITY_DN6247_c0_g2_i11:217-1179(-)
MIVRVICTFFVYTPDFCEIAMDNLMRPILGLYLGKAFDEIRLCKKFGFCRYPSFILDDAKAYTYRVLKDKPPRKEVEVDPEGETFTFVAFADVHVDAYYEEGSEASCDIPICCRNKLRTDKDGEPIEKGPVQKAGKWGTVAHCDIPYRTLYHFMNFTAEVIKPDFYLWLGDNTPHDVWNIDTRDHIEPEKKITEQFVKVHKYDGIGKVYPIVGNHEGMPSDQYNINGTEHSWILSNLTAIWGKHWLTEECKRGRESSEGAAEQDGMLRAAAPCHEPQNGGHLPARHGRRQPLPLEKFHQPSENCKNRNHSVARLARGCIE